MTDNQESDGRGEQRLSAPLDVLERATVLIERPVRKISGSHRLNPLPHAGTITVFLLGVVIVSGLYITLFFEFGYGASYDSVQAMNDHAIQRVVRALHRYSSAILVLTTVVHAWRILVARRFTGRQRRWRWMSGVSALVLVWLTGVTGYWLVWDVRAQALSEVVNSLFGSFGWGAGLMVRSLSGTDGGSGSGTLLVIWFLHLGLTIVVGWFTYRHVRRTRLPILPPTQWMVIMGGALAVVSVAIPLEMLSPADPGAFALDMPLDPFVLFLLPPLLSAGAWWWSIAALVLFLAVIALPKLLTRSDPGVVQIDDTSCTGCDLCVVDCPYEALRLIDRTDQLPLAVVDPAACVGCGICVGACSFGAMSMPGEDAPVDIGSVEGRHVVVACERHDVDDIVAADPDAIVRSVRCAGVINPASLAADHKAGAAEVQVIGCAPGECRFGVGNAQLAERLAGERAPRLPRKYAGQVAEDFVAVGSAAAAVADPGGHPVADDRSLGFGREAFVGAGALVAVSVLAVAAATRAPFHADTDRAEVRVVVDHEAGRPLVLDPDTPIDSIDSVRISSSDGLVERSIPMQGDNNVGVVDVALSADVAEVSILAVTGEDEVLVASAAAPESGERLLIQLRDVARPVVASDGERVFNARSSGCAVCHSVTPGDDGVGPSLGAIADVAGERVRGLDAENYLRQSILLPDQFVLPGWPEGQMSPFYRDTLSEEDLDALIAYLLTLEGPDQ